MKQEYHDALQYLYSYTDYEKQSGFRYDADRFDLRRVRRLFALLGNPHRRFRSVHIAGTKGKGSTSAMLASILHKVGYRTALYTSPHLHTFRERAQVNGSLISEEQVIAGVDRLRPAAAQVAEITTFELITALAFDHFARQGAEYAVVEVGMGGRLDATNVIRPLVSVITSISFDHMMYLGNTLGEIAFEKAGIIKSRVPVVSARQADQAQQVIARVAAGRKAPLTLIDRDWAWESVCTSSAGQQFAAWPTAHPELRAIYDLPLLGRHQQHNATLVLAVVAELRRAGVEIPDEATHEGLKAVRWPGRLEVLGQHPWVVVDGAHNGDSMHQLRLALAELFPHREMILILGTSADKDIDSMLDAILPAASKVLVSEAHHPRAAEAEALAQRVAARGKHAVVAPVDQVLDAALHMASEDDMICATGSLFLVADIRVAWLRLTHKPLPPSDIE